MTITTPSSSRSIWMPMQAFEAHVRHKAASSVIDLCGEMDALAQPALDRAYNDAARSEVRQIVLNFHKATYINSSGLALIVGILARARKEQRDVVAFGLTEHYR